MRRQLTGRCGRGDDVMQLVYQQNFALPCHISADSVIHSILISIHAPRSSPPQIITIPRSPARRRPALRWWSRALDVLSACRADYQTQCPSDTWRGEGAVTGFMLEGGGRNGNVSGNRKIITTGDQISPRPLAPAPKVPHHHPLKSSLPAPLTCLPP